MRVLCFTPYAERLNGKPGGFTGIRPETLAALLQIEAAPGAMDRMLATEAGPDWRANIVEVYRRARRIVLAEGYDALLTIEADNLPPRDTLTKLLAVPEAGIVYGLGVLRQGTEPGLTALKAVAGGHSIGSPLTCRELAPHWGQPVEVTGVAFQTTLIYRHVLERFDFEHPDPGTFQADLLLSTRCLRAGIRQVCHTGVTVGHITPRGTVLWPTPGGIEEQRHDQGESAQAICGCHRGPVLPGQSGD